MTQPVARATTTRRRDRAPRLVSLFNPVSRRVLAAGVPLGPNALVTVRGRTSGLPRSTPLAIIEADGRRWVWSPWGDVAWVRNLRAAGRATIEVRGRREDVTATELDDGARLAWFRDTLRRVARGIRGGVLFIRLVDGVDLRDPDAAARGKVVFELHRLP